MEGIREFKNYTLLDNISIEGLEALLNEYPELTTGGSSTTLKLSYATMPNAENWTIVDWNFDGDLKEDIFFWLNQNILSWLCQDGNSKSASQGFALAFEENSPMMPTLFSQVDPENALEDTTVGIYEEEHFSYYLPDGEVEMGDEVDLKFNIVDFLLDDFSFDLDWLVDADSFEWVEFPISLEYDEL